MAGQGQQRGGRPQSRRGDFTGNKKDDLAAEHAEAVAAREQELGLINQAVGQAREDGVVDMMALDGSGKLEKDGESTDEVVDQTGPTTTLRTPEQEAEDAGRELLGFGSSISIVEMPEEKPRAELTSKEAKDADALNAPTMVRSRYDLEDITLGYNNTVTLKAGWRYKLPRWAAIHLEEKGLVDVLQLSAT